MPIVRLTLLSLLLLVAAALRTSAQTPPADPDSSEEVILDAVAVPCNDTTESILITRGGRMIYARGVRGITYMLDSAIMRDLNVVMKEMDSYVETDELDTCTTIGVILEGPRYVLLNSKRPNPDVRDLQLRVERLRRAARRKLDGTINNMSDRLEGSADTQVVQAPAITASELRRGRHVSPVLRQWRCHGTVTVVCRVQRDGHVRQAFVKDVSEGAGKCASLMVVGALRAVLLADFTPGARQSGRTAASWIQIDVPFTGNEK